MIPDFYAVVPTSVRMANQQTAQALSREGSRDYINKFDPAGLEPGQGRHSLYAIRDEMRAIEEDKHPQVPGIMDFSVQRRPVEPKVKVVGDFQVRNGGTNIVNTSISDRISLMQAYQRQNALEQAYPRGKVVSLGA